MKKYHVIFPNPNGEGNRIYGLVRTETMGLRMTRMGRKAYYFSDLTKLTESEIKNGKEIGSLDGLDLNSTMVTCIYIDRLGNLILELEVK